MVIIGDLSLTSCSEIIENVSLSNYYQVDKEKTKTKASLMKKYIDINCRDIMSFHDRNGRDNMSFHDFVKNGLNTDNDGICKIQNIDSTLYRRNSILQVASQ
jgi:hypothetical protein